MHFQKKKLQNRHKLCIFNMTLFAYDYLFEQQGNSHDEYPWTKALPIKGHDMIIVHHLGQLSQDSENLWKGQPTWGKSPSESLGALDDQTKIFWWYDNMTLLTVTTPCILSTDIVEKNTTHNQRPTRLTHLGKIRDENEKICTPGKSKTWKGGLGKNGYPGGLKNRKGGPGKS